MVSLCRSAQGTPRASAKISQRSRTQLRAKMGADCAAGRTEGAGASEEVPAADQTQTTVAGTGDKISCDAVETVASDGARSGAGADWQQGIGQRAVWQQVVLPVTGDWADAANACAQTSIRLQMMVSAIFTSILSPGGKCSAGRMLLFAGQFLSVLSAARIFDMYFSGSLSNFFLQLLQQSFTS